LVEGEVSLNCGGLLTSSSGESVSAGIAAVETGGGVCSERFEVGSSTAQPASKQRAGTSQAIWCGWANALQDMRRTRIDVLLEFCFA
jgi:hypothetical protein